MIYKHFDQSNFTKQSINYFFENASQIIERLRETSWKEFQEKEHAFTSEMRMFFMGNALVTEIVKEIGKFIDKIEHL